MKKFFTVIGGMGTQATESFIHLLNKRTPAHCDQDYLDYVVVNDATVPDRTAYIVDPENNPSPLAPLSDDIKQQSKLNPEFFAMPCNTAHFFYDELQALTDIPLLHMPRIAVEAIEKKFPGAKRIGLIATEGTLKDKIYDQELTVAGYEVIHPTPAVADETMKLIYQDVKEQNYVDPQLYYEILNQMAKLGAQVIILGCTELSVAEERAGSEGYNVIDAQGALVDKCIELGEKMQKGK